MIPDLTMFRNLLEALESAPGSRPFVTFWIDEDERETLTFSEFRNRARSQAAILRSQGIGPSDRIILILPQGITAMTTFVGAMMVGAVPSLLAYPNFKVEASKYRAGLAGVTANLQAKAILIDRQFPDEMLEHVSLGEGAELFRVEESVDDGSESQLPGINLEIGLDWEIAHENLAFIQHSAGTTGLQKGVALTHAAVLRQISHLANALKVDTETDRVYSWLPLYHDMGLIACFMLPMACHLPVIMQSPIDWVMHPETTLQIISECKCTLAWMPNFAFQFIPRRSPEKRWAGYDLSSLRALINCSEPVRSSSMKEFERAFSKIGLKRAVLQSSYAMAETVFAVAQSEVGGEAGPATIWADGVAFRTEHKIVRVTREAAGALSFTSSGRILPGNEVRIVSTAGPELDDGEVGEILVRSDSMLSGYFNRPDLTETALVDGWYLSGDLGFLLDGELYVIGRKKDLLIVGGENLYPQDIEEIVVSHPSIHDGRVVAMGVYNPELGTEDLVVVAEVEREELLTRSDEIEREVRKLVVGGIGVAVRTIFLKPPKWIVKSTAGKAARSATREKLLREHPELNGGS